MFNPESVPSSERSSDKDFSFSRSLRSKAMETLLFSLAGSSLGCTIQPASPPPLNLRQLTASEIEHFKEPTPTKVEIKSTKVDDEVRITKGKLCFDELELKFTTYYPEHKSEPAPLIIILPILGGGQSVDEYFGKAFAKIGFASGCMERPGSTLREHESIDELNSRFQSAVETQRAFISWIVSQGRVDGQLIGCLGLSMGGMLGTVLKSVDARIDWAALCLAGADLPDVLVHSNEIRALRWGGEQMQQHGISVRELQTKLREGLEHDPSYYAQTIDPSSILFISADFDLTMPRRNSELLWECLHRPLKITVPTEHYSSFLLIWWITPHIIDFAYNRFNLPKPVMEQD